MGVDRGGRADVGRAPEVRGGEHDEGGSGRRTPLSRWATRVSRKCGVAYRSPYWLRAESESWSLYDLGHWCFHDIWLRHRDVGHLRDVFAQREDYGHPAESVSTWEVDCGGFCG